MQIVSDILLSAGALGAAVYCMVLSRRLRSFSRLEDGMGGAVATLSVQVDDMTRVLGEARLAAGESSRRLAEEEGLESLGVHGGPVWGRKARGPTASDTSDGAPLSQAFPLPPR